MKKWYAEEYAFEIEVTSFLRGSRTERYCRNGEEIGDRYTCTYGCPVNGEGQGICSKVMMMLFPIMEAVRSGGDLENIGGVVFAAGFFYFQRDNLKGYFYSHSTKPNQFCLEIILCRIRGAFDYLMYPYYPAYMG